MSILINVVSSWLLFAIGAEWFVMLKLIGAQKNKDFMDIMEQQQNPIKMHKLKKTGIVYEGYVIKNERCCQKIISVFPVTLVVIFTAITFCCKFLPQRDKHIVGAVYGGTWCTGVAYLMWLWFWLRKNMKKLHRFEYDMTDKELRF